MEGYIDLKTLTLDELLGVVNLYPWYGAARKEICLRMAGSGGEGWGKSQFSDAALYIAKRECLADIYRAGENTDWADKDMEEIVKSYIAKGDEPMSGQKQVRALGGDYFTQAEYDNVRKSEDSVFSGFAAKASGDGPEKGGKGLEDEFCTETLAAIYAEQGYFEQAKNIYSRLLLKFPKKSPYFAALISELDKKTTN